MIRILEMLVYSLRRLDVIVAEDAQRRSLEVIVLPGANRP
jgi:hypothetical protein